MKQLIALALVAALPLLGDALRSGTERCAFDGVEVRPEFRVRIDEHAFCGVRCARSWLRQSGGTAGSIRVTDLATGREIDAETAWYLRTAFGSGGGAPDLIRVFARKEDAERHAKAHRGTILTGEKRPFARGGK